MIDPDFESWDALASGELDLGEAAHLRARLPSVTGGPAAVAASEAVVRRLEQDAYADVPPLAAVRIARIESQLLARIAVGPTLAEPSGNARRMGVRLALGRVGAVAAVGVAVLAIQAMYRGADSPSEPSPAIARTASGSASDVEPNAAPGVTKDEWNAPRSGKFARRPRWSAEQMKVFLANPSKYKAAIEWVEQHIGQIDHRYTYATSGVEMWIGYGDSIRDPAAIGARGTFRNVGETAPVRAADEPESTVALETDTASYAVVRQCLVGGRMPAAAMIRLEELVNYFHYAYALPLEGEPLALDVELTSCPWACDHRIVRVGLQAPRPPAVAERPAANLVLLIDVSGSMQDSLKLPLLVEALQAMIPHLGPNDRVAIAVYAGAAGLVLPSTPASERDAILGALSRLEAGGSTNAGEGIRLAYEQAVASLIPGGINRVILCTDGDFNVGVTDTDALVELARQYAARKVFLTVLGVGAEVAFNDALLEAVANRCDGHYAFLDSAAEANRVLVEQLCGTIQTVAKDTKLQVIFDPARVWAYRLLGYEDRRLSVRDFDDDQKDAGEIGMGHTSTALYEIIPATPGVAEPGPLLRVRLRYKRPDADVSTLRELAVPDTHTSYFEASGETQLALAVAEFALVLHGSAYAPHASLEAAHELAEAAIRRFPDGRPPADLAARKELVELIGHARALARGTR